jgi:hypothetical protein
MLTVALGFLAIARLSRSPLHAMVALGFALLAVGFLFVAASHFGRVGADLVDAVRIFCQLTGALVLVFAYGSYHLTGRVHGVLLLVASVGAVLALGVVFYWVVPPIQSLVLLPTYIAVAYGMMSACYLGCFLLSGYGWHKRPTWGRAMVPLAFLAWTLSTYTCSLPRTASSPSCTAGACSPS